MINLSQSEIDFIASSLLYIHRLPKVWSDAQDAEGLAIVEKLASMEAQGR